MSVDSSVKRVEPSGAVSGIFHVPGSKSLTNRALVCAALARGESLLGNASDSNDTALMANGLNQLGVLVRRTAPGLVVHGTDARLTAPKFPIPIGNAGTTLRFLLSVAALASGRVVLEGSPRMAERPNVDLVDALRNLGVSIEHEQSTARFEVDGRSLKGGSLRIRGDKSSQFLSSLLLIGSYAPGGISVKVDGILASPSYVDLTIDVMMRFGAEVERVKENSYRVGAGQRYRSSEYPVEPDASGASYGFAAAAIAGGEVTVPGLTRRSLQADVNVVHALQRMGCSVDETDRGLKVGRTETLKGITIDMHDMPDAVPTLAVAALFAEGKTSIRNVAHLRYKESDRLRALAGELAKTGASIVEHEDGLDITPVALHGAELDTHADHRLAMSFALLGLKISGIRVLDPGCVEKSFPGFWNEFEGLRNQA